METTTYATIEAPEELLNILKERFGLTTFRSGQLRVIEALLAGRSAAAVFPTGGGKSLCYQLPALQFEGLTLVISPLIALMKDQIEALARRGIDAVRLDSSLTNDEFRDAMQRIRNRQVKLLYVAPERFFNERFREALRGLRISLFAIDEAHCISQWGHNFRPDYLKLAQLAREYQAERVLALTATATVQVLENICEEFSIEAADAVCTQFYRENLLIRTSVCQPKGREESLLAALKSRPTGASLIYVTLQQTAEALAERLCGLGWDARPYHGGLPDEERSRVQEWFIGGAAPIVVATIAFGMGIDKGDLRYVYHYNAPKSIESYVQEIGRAGRDGNDALCELFLVPQDRVVLENFVFGDTPTRDAIATLVERIKGQPSEFQLSYYHLSAECDIRQLVVRTLLTYLELDGFIRATSPRYETYDFKPLVSSQQILAKLSGEPRQFASRLLAQAERRKVRFRINVAQVSKHLGCERNRIFRALDFFSEQGWLELEVSNLVHGYHRLEPITDPIGLTDALDQRMQHREKNEIDRLDQVFAFVTGRECQAARLSAHFGQSLEQPCGRCSACLQENPLSIPPSKPIAMGTSALTSVRPLIGQHPKALGQPRQAARFLCGLSSPALVAARLTRHDLFGCCQNVPFRTVLAACEIRD